MGFLGSLLGGVFGLFGANKNAQAQESANKTNLQIAQMNNEYNERMLQKQLDYNTVMWNKQNQYNSAGAQRARLKAAGLNPYMMMNGGSAGTATAANGIIPPRAQQVQVQPVHYDFGSVNNLISQLLDIQAQKGVRDSVENYNNNQVASERAMRDARVRQIESDIIGKNQKSLSDYYQSMNFMQMYNKQLATFSSDVDRAAREAENAKYTGMLIQAQTIYQMMQGQLSAKELSTFDSRFNQEMAIMAAQQYSLVASGAQSYAQAKQAISNALESEARTRGIKIDNHVKSALINTTIGTAQQVYKQQFYDAKQSKDYNAWYNTMGKYTDALGNVFNTVVGAGLGWSLGRGRSPKTVKGFRK